jgi:hypothetical protein
MTITYAALNNTPCCITRSVGIETGDTGAVVRVGVVGCPLPAVWGIGTPENPVFFQKLKAAAKRLAGVLTDEELSGLVFPFSFFQMQPGIPAVPPAPSWDEILHLSYPDGRLLEAPFFESVEQAGGPYDSNTAGHAAVFRLSDIVFEDTGGSSAPRYADMLLDYDTAEPHSFLPVIKIFHSLTT